MDKKKFKVGDKVKVISDLDNIVKSGSIGTITEIRDGYGSEYPFLVKIQEKDLVNKSDIEEYEDCEFSFSEEELTTPNGKVRVPKVNFLLKYDLEDDPIEEFETMKEVDDRIKEIIEEYPDELDRETITVYEVKKKYDVKVKVNTVISKKVA